MWLIWTQKFEREVSKAIRKDKKYKTEKIHEVIEENENMKTQKLYYGKKEIVKLKNKGDKKTTIRGIILEIKNAPKQLYKSQS